MSRFYITTPIYYVNDMPHIGHVYTTIVADVIARYRRLCGEETYFLTGTDEHGQKIERAAQERGITPLALADQVVTRYHEHWKEFGISHDDFIRTTQERHRCGVEEIIRRIAASGDLYLSRHEGWYCSGCETFYTEKELLPGRICPIHERPTEWQSEENIFFRLSKYQDRLLEWYDQSPAPVRPESRANEVRAFVAAGLRDLSVSRTQLGWGIPFPEHAGHVVYVWLDALTNYVSALGFGHEGEARARYERFWEQGGVRMHLMGKDILRFHAVYWPAFLMSAGLPLPTLIFAHGWWLRDERKMSKSVGNVVRPDELVASFGSDSLRYFFLREMVFGQDASFSDEAFIDRYNSDLANDLGNTVSRLATLVRKGFDGRTPPAAAGSPLEATARAVTAEYRAAMDGFAFHRALEALWRLLAEANQYLVAQEPWKKLKDPRTQGDAGEVLWNASEAVRIVAVGLLPVMPKKAAEALAALGASVPASLEALAWGGLPAGAELAETGAIFPRIDKAQYLAKTPAVEEKELINIDRFFETELRVATVVAAEPVPKSSKLLKLTVDVGEENPRTVVGGIAQQYTPESLVGKQVVIVANLEPAKLMGIESNGMVLAASEDGKPVLLHPEKPVPNGTRVK